MRNGIKHKQERQRPRQATPHASFTCRPQGLITHSSPCAAAASPRSIPNEMERDFLPDVCACFLSSRGKTCPDDRKLSKSRNHLPVSTLNMFEKAQPARQPTDLIFPIHSATPALKGAFHHEASCFGNLSWCKFSLHTSSATRAGQAIKEHKPNWRQSRCHHNIGLWVFRCASAVSCPGCKKDIEYVSGGNGCTAWTVATQMHSHVCHVAL